MIKRDVEIGGVYRAKVSGNCVKVRIECPLKQGWLAINLITGRDVRIRTAARLTQIDRGGSWTSST